MGDYSNADVIQEGALTNDYGWLQGEGVVQNGQKSDDIICHPLTTLFIPQ